MVGRPRQDRSTIRGVTVAVRLPAAVVEALDALVQLEKKQIVEAGLGGTVSRTSLIESLILVKARQVGLVHEGGSKTKTLPSTAVSRSSEKSKAKRKTGRETSKKTRTMSIWQRVRKPQV